MFRRSVSHVPYFGKRYGNIAIEGSLIETEGRLFHKRGEIRKEIFAKPSS
jgi:hypothetical protein